MPDELSNRGLVVGTLVVSEEGSSVSILLGFKVGA